MAQEFVLPDLGEGITEAQVVRVMISEGDQVEEDQALMEVETDKAAVEIPSPYKGVAKKVHVAEGQTIKVGDVMVTFSDDGQGKAEPSDKKEAEAKPKKQERKEPEGDSQEEEGDEDESKERPASKEESERSRPSKTIPASPAVRKLAREMGVDLASVAGSGPGGRVRREDVEEAAKGGKSSRRPDSTAQPAQPRPSAPPPDRTLPGKEGKDSWGPIRTQPLSQIRKTIANQMARSVYTIPHVAHCDDADISELDALRRKFRESDPDQKMTLMPFIIKAVARSLRIHPGMNSSFDAEGNQIVYKDYVNMGIAVDTERGLVVPSLRNADQLSVGQIANQLNVIADKARRAAFSVDELRGGTFTITNVGANGGRYSTPIINYPEAAILGIGRARKEPVVLDDQVVVRLIMPLSLSFDHRAIDGAAAAAFCRDVIASLENPLRMIM
jgi:pyruvate/2-oxoglutarate dehydrogenase complex dihydrolipoamide acyltransferase (E2) component